MRLSVGAADALVAELKKGELNNEWHYKRNNQETVIR